MEELKQVIVVRKDLKMGKGKTAAQVAHATLTVADKSEHTWEWLGQGQKKSILVCEDEKELLQIFKEAKKAGLPAEIIIDAGRTQVPTGTKTCVGIGPAPGKEIDKITGKLKLL